jgi:hypothetical protein
MINFANISERIEARALAMQANLSREARISAQAPRDRGERTLRLGKSALPYGSLFNS